MAKEVGLVKNKKARFDYEILETFEAGVVLLGSEAKSLYNGKGSLVDSYVVVRRGEVYWVGGYIAPYERTHISYQSNPYRDRKLLLHKNEINKLQNELKSKGTSVIPLRIYISNAKNKKLKIEIALARGKKKHDKREALKERDFVKESKEYVG